MTTTEHPNLPTALAAFQAEMPKVHKGKTARIPGRDGKSGYAYDYADLADVTAAVMPLLTKHGLSFTCLPTRTEQGGYELVARILHVSGESVEGALPIAGRQAQEIGSSLTYNRRYLLGCLTGVVTDDDEDGTMATQAPPAQEAPYVPPLPRHVQVLRALLDTLDPTQAGTLRAWWGVKGLPQVDALSEGQAAEATEAVAQVKAGVSPLDPS